MAEKILEWPKDVSREMIDQLAYNNRVIHNCYVAGMQYGWDYETILRFCVYILAQQVDQLENQFKEYVMNYPMPVFQKGEEKWTKK